MSTVNSSLLFKEAQQSDLATIIQLLSDDKLGSARENTQDTSLYLTAFNAIQTQSGNSIIVAVAQEQIVGVFQLTFVPGLSRNGMLRAQIEAVRVNQQYRGQGIGKALIQHALKLAKKAGCGMVQLTSDKQRTDALRFYENLGFTASHEGFKLLL